VARKIQIQVRFASLLSTLGAVRARSLFVCFVLHVLRVLLVSYSQVVPEIQIQLLLGGAGCTSPSRNYHSGANSFLKLVIALLTS
jgi:hypothetical protein